LGGVVSLEITGKKSGKRQDETKYRMKSPRRKNSSKKKGGRRSELGGEQSLISKSLPLFPQSRGVGMGEFSSAAQEAKSKCRTKKAIVCQW